MTFAGFAARAADDAAFVRDAFRLVTGIHPGAAERAAVEELRARSAAAAAAAAGSIIAAQHGATADKALVDEAIAGI